MIDGNSVERDAGRTTAEFPRFGSFSYAPEDVFEFTWGLPGFPGLHRWIALTLASQPNFVWLQSLDDLTVAVPTADPYAIFDTYAPRIPASAIAALEIADPSDFTMLCVVVVTPQAEDMTMNLLAPILLNLKTRRGRQVALESSSYSVKTSIPRVVPAPPAASATLSNAP